MKLGWLNRLRLHRLWMVQAVLLALVAPMLLALVADAGGSSASRLERDLALSVCSPDRQGELPGEGHLPAHTESCVLCSVCAAAASRTPGEAAMAFAGPSLLPAPEVYSQAALLRPPQALLLFGSPPRGPPSILLV
jgi:hypothetical protein